MTVRAWVGPYVARTRKAAPNRGAALLENWNTDSLITQHGRDGSGRVGGEPNHFAVGAVETSNPIGQSP